jgi:tetratricopeptide (TPR) repeat protein
LYEAIRLLTDAADLGDADPNSAAVLGLCALALGDAPAAAQQWELCLQHAPGRADARAWLDALRGGVISNGLEYYNQALVQAQRGDLVAANTSACTALETLPEFVPALRLQGLLAAQEGRPEEARRVWTRAVSICADDPQLLRYLAAIQVEPRREPSRPRRRPARLPWVAAGAVLGAVGAGVVLLARPEPPVSALRGVATARTEAPASSVLRTANPAAEPPSGETVPPAPARFSLSDYRLGRLAVREGAWGAAIHHLRSALSAPSDLYFHDDALYLLASAYARIGDADAARAAAAQLLQQHPSSIYANSMTRRLATQVTE